MASPSERVAARARTAFPQGFPVFDPNNPFGYMTGNTQANMSGVFNRALGGALGAGVFDPTGNQALLGALRQDAQRQSLGRGRAAMNFARTNNLDPSTYGLTALMAQFGNQSDLANSLLNARLQSGMANQGFFQNLFGTGLENEFGWLSRDQQYKINQGLAQAKPKSDFGSTLGQLGGAALGAIPGFGGGGRMQQAAPRMGQQGFTYPFYG